MSLLKRREADRRLGYLQILVDKFEELDKQKKTEMMVAFPDIYFSLCVLTVWDRDNLL